MSLERSRKNDQVVSSPFTVVFRLSFALAFPLLLMGVSCTQVALKGRLILSGSATLAPLVGNSVEQWKRLHPGVEVAVQAIGSDAGLEQLIRYNDADLALVSRPLVPADFDAAKAAGKVLVPLPLAWDAVCLVVPASNTWARSLTRVQAEQAFTTASFWSDLDPLWPHRPIYRFVLGPNSGTADVFATGIFADGRKDRLFAAPGAQSSEDDRILARGIAQVDGALGYLGWGTFVESSRSLKVLAFEGVEPTATTIADHSYGLPRQLWLVATTQSLASSPAVRSLVAFLYANYAALTKTTGLVPLTESELLAVQSTLKDRVP